MGFLSNLFNEITETFLGVSYDDDNLNNTTSDEQEYETRIHEGIISRCPKREERKDAWGD